MNSGVMSATNESNNFLRAHGNWILILSQMCSAAVKRVGKALESARICGFCGKRGLSRRLLEVRKKITRMGSGFSAQSTVRSIREGQEGSLIS